MLGTGSRSTLYQAAEELHMKWTLIELSMPSHSHSDEVAVSIENHAKMAERDRHSTPDVAPAAKVFCPSNSVEAHNMTSLPAVTRSLQTYSETWQSVDVPRNPLGPIAA